MIKNGKYFVAAQQSSDNFKVLFARLAAEGAGRPVDQHGFADGPWTPESLADAISSLEGNEKGIELRAVQMWFQDNDNGIGNDNIKWLARIFGCDDPEETSRWQAEIMASRERLRTERREKKKAASYPEAQTQVEAATRTRGRYGLAKATEAMFGGSPLNLPATVFAGAVALGFMSYFLGNHSVTFDAPDGQSKQVGFLWAPNWTFLFMAFMPLFFASVSELLFFWKDDGRSRIVARGNQGNSADAWTRNIETSTYTFWAVLVICLLFAGVFQWVGVRLLPLIQGGGNYATDWGSLAITRPEVISVPEAIAFTGIAYLYMCICFYLFFAGLILLYSVVLDFGKVLARSRNTKDADHQQEVSMVGTTVMRGIFRCTVLAIFVAVCMKLQSSYLTSSGTNILRWLISDMSALFDSTGKAVSLGKYSAPNHYSSLLVVVAAVFVFLFGAFRLDVGSGNQIAFWIMAATVGLLVAGYLLIGAFAGFSVLLGIAVLLATTGLIIPGFRTEKRRELRGDQSVS